MTIFKYDPVLGKVVEHKEAGIKNSRRLDVNKGESLPENFSRVENREVYEENLERIFGKKSENKSSITVYRTIDGIVYKEER